MMIGRSNIGGELGHMTIVANGRKCHCPNLGCLEAYASGWALADRAKEAVSANPSAGQCLLSLAGKIEDITAITVSKALRKGDYLAHFLVEETGQYLGAGAVSIVNAFDPFLLILGGGVIEGMPELITIVEKHVRERALKIAAKNFRVVKAGLGKHAGMVGAATLARAELLENYRF
jgi:glucokinase